jgi:hypothetical protein
MHRYDDGHEKRFLIRGRARTTGQLPLPIDMGSCMDHDHSNSTGRAPVCWTSGRQVRSRVYVSRLPCRDREEAGRGRATYRRCQWEGNAGRAGRPVFEPISQGGERHASACRDGRPSVLFPFSSERNRLGEGRASEIHGSAFKHPIPTLMRAMPRQGPLIASRVSRFVGLLRAFEPSTLAPELGSSSKYGNQSLLRAIKGDPSICLCFFPGLAWKAKEEGAFQGDGTKVSGRLCARSRRK